MLEERKKSRNYNKQTVYTIRGKREGKGRRKGKIEGKKIIIKDTR
jgi:hypothetical protein